MNRPNLGPALLSVVPDIRPEPAPFAGLCKSLARRRTQVDPAWYLGAVKHLVGRYEAECTNGLAQSLAIILDNDGLSRLEAIDEWQSAARQMPDRDGVALADLLLTLTEEQREGL